MSNSINFGSLAPITRAGGMDVNSAPLLPDLAPAPAHQMEPVAREMDELAASADATADGGQCARRGNTTSSPSQTNAGLKDDFTRVFKLVGKLPCLTVAIGP
jgi:hypothetical protein